MHVSSCWLLLLPRCRRNRRCGAERILGLETIAYVHEAFRQDDAVVFQCRYHRELNLQRLGIGVLYKIIGIGLNHRRKIQFKLNHAYHILVTGLFGGKQLFDLSGLIRLALIGQNLLGSLDKDPGIVGLIIADILSYTCTCIVCAAVVTNVAAERNVATRYLLSRFMKPPAGTATVRRNSRNLAPGHTRRKHTRRPQCDADWSLSRSSAPTTFTNLGHPL